MSLLAIGRAQSGMQVAGARLNATANNTANLNTEGYREYEVQAVENESGVKAKVRRAPQPGADAIGNAMEMKSAYLMFVANLRVVERSDEMLGQTMDILA